MSLAHWEELFGDSFQALFVFAYDVLTDRAPLPEAQLFRYRNGLYGFVGVRLRDYAAAAHIISPSWDTVAMPTAEFRRIARPVDAWLGAGVEAEPVAPALEQGDPRELLP